jgi:hypothetical protein
VRVVLGEVAHVRLDLVEAALDGAAQRARGGVSSVNHVGSSGVQPYTRGRLHDDVAHRRVGRRRRGEQVHRADDVGLVHGALRHLRRVDDEEGVDDRVDAGGTHDLGEDRVVRVDAHVLGAFEFDVGLLVSRPTITSTFGSLERLRDPATPERAQAGHEDAADVVRTHPNQTDRRRRSMSNSASWIIERIARTRP